MCFADCIPGAVSDCGGYRSVPGFRQFVQEDQPVHEQLNKRAVRQGGCIVQGFK